MDQLENNPQPHIQTYADNNLNEKNFDQSLVFNSGEVFNDQQHNIDYNNANIQYTYDQSQMSETVAQMPTADVHNVYVTEESPSVTGHYADNVLLDTAADGSGNVQETVYQQAQDAVQTESVQETTYDIQQPTQGNVYEPDPTPDQNSQPSTSAEPESFPQGEVIQTEITEITATEESGAAVLEETQGDSLEQTQEQNYIVEEPENDATVYASEFAENNPPDEENIEVIPLPEELGQVEGVVQEVHVEEVTEDSIQTEEPVVNTENISPKQPEPIELHEDISDDGELQSELNAQTGEMELKKVDKVEEQMETEVAADQEQIVGDSTVAADAITEVVEQTAELSQEQSGEVEMIDEELVDDPMHVEESKVDITTGQKRRGRKSTNDIPLHVLGHDLQKPVDNMLNGRSVKPRLGVKVPPRNLTSQILSKEELQNAIIERSRKKRDAEVAAAGSKSFANQLTRRLVDKIAPCFHDSDDTKQTDTKDITVIDDASATKDTETSTGSATGTEPVEDTESAVAVGETEKTNKTVEDTDKTSTIKDNSDLLAILEGEGEEMPVLAKEIEQANVDETNIKNLEREIALQQLSDLPYLSPKQRTYRGRMCKEPKAPQLVAQVSVKSANVASTSRGTNTPTTGHFNKENSKTPTTVIAPVSPKKEDKSIKKGPVEVEPQIKVNMALKTYSRKRKSSDTAEIYPEAKRSVAEFVTEVKSNKNDNPTIPTDVYVTKSSRVIKRKVIWDPDDEVPTRSPKHVFKSDTPSAPAKVTPVKSIKPEKIDKTPETKTTTEKKVEVPKTKTEKKDDKPVAKKLETPQKKSAETPPKKTLETPQKKTVEAPQKKSVEPTTRKVSESSGVKKTPEATNKKTPETPVKKTTENAQKVTDTPQKQKIPQTDKKNTVSPSSKVGMKYKKTRSEVDKLLGDEGAIKMLYELKNNEETETRRKKSTISVDKTYKDLAKKATQIKSELVNTSTDESPNKSLRKKEAQTPPSVPLSAPQNPTKAVVGAAVSRQKSKDSSRSTPPASPAYNFPNAETYLIRRRSSSSFSSGGEDDSEERVSRSKAKRAKKVLHDTPKESKKDPLELDSDKERKSLSVSDVERVEKTKIKVDNKFGAYDTFTVRKSGKHVTIDLNYGGNESYLTLNTLVDLTQVLSKVALEKDCNVVLITSSCKSFCLGLDYRFLISDDEVERKKKATELSWEVSNFLKCLLYFPKILVAGIQGECVGLGVTMLPLFDIVVASDISSFRTEYSTLGCVAEACFLMTMPHLNNRGFASELLYTTQKMSADDAFRRGFVSKLCWPEKYQESLKQLVISIAKGSRQSLEATKKRLNSSTLSTTSAAIESMEKQLIQHWTSTECQKNFNKIDSDDGY